MELPHCDRLKTKATHVADINVKSSKDEYDGSISGCAVISSNRLIIVDQRNQLVKLADTQSNKKKSELLLSSSPWDATEINKNQAAVTLFNTHKILLLSVSDTLTLDREITVDGECRGVAYSKDRLVVTYVRPGKLEIMDLSGKVLLTVEKDSDGNQLFDSPFYVCVSKDGKTMFVSDYGSNKVTSLSFNGEVKSVYNNSELQNPEKVCVDEDDNVFVCCRYSRNVHMLTADLNKIKIILTQQDGLDSELYSVCHGQGGLLYVGMIKNNKVKVFQLSTQ